MSHWTPNILKLGCLATLIVSGDIAYAETQTVLRLPPLRRARNAQTTQRSASTLAPASRALTRRKSIQGEIRLRRKPLLRGAEVGGNAYNQIRRTDGTQLLEWHPANGADPVILESFPLTFRRNRNSSSKILGWGYRIKGNKSSNSKTSGLDRAVRQAAADEQQWFVDAVQRVLNRTDRLRARIGGGYSELEAMGAIEIAD